MADSAPAATGTTVLVRTWRDADLDAPELLDAGAGSVAVYSHRRPGGDVGNEDGALVLAFADGRAVLAVADGIGGHHDGARAAAVALDALAESVANADARGRELREGILDGFELAHSRVADLAGNGGSTLIAVAIERDGLRPFHVGDSAALMSGQRGRLKHLTPAHSPVGYAVEAGLLDEEEAIQHEDRHLVSNAIGIGPMKIELGPVVPLAAHDTLVVGSDGLFDNLRTEEIIEIVRRGPLKRVANQLVARSRDRMAGDGSDHPSKPDDLTFVVWRRRRPRRSQG